MSRTFKAEKIEAMTKLYTGLISHWVDEKEVAAVNAVIMDSLGKSALLKIKKEAWKRILK